MYWQVRRDYSQNQRLFAKVKSWISNKKKVLEKLKTKEKIIVTISEKTDRLKILIDGVNFKPPSQSDLDFCFRLFLWFDKLEVERISEDIMQPVIMRVIAKLMLENLEKPSLEWVKFIMDRTFGTPTQRLETKSQNINVNIDSMTSQEVLEYLKNNTR